MRKNHLNKGKKKRKLKKHSEKIGQENPRKKGKNGFKKI